MSGGPKSATSQRNMSSSLASFTLKPSTGSSSRLLYSRANARSALPLGAAVLLLLLHNSLAPPSFLNTLSLTEPCVSDREHPEWFLPHNQGFPGWKNRFAREERVATERSAEPSCGATGGSSGQQWSPLSRAFARHQLIFGAAADTERSADNQAWNALCSAVAEPKAT